MDLKAFRQRLREDPERVEFEDTMALIDALYQFTPCAFRNGALHNEAGQNNGSCKLFACAALLGLTQAETLACFGRYYRVDVLGKPAGSSHPNIRNFMAHGWAGIHYEQAPLHPRQTLTTVTPGA